MTRTLLVLVTLAAVMLGGCEESLALSWTYEVPAGIEVPGSFVVARIREDGCGLADEVIYEVRPRDVSGATIPTPELDADETYCFDVTLEDPACAVYARSTQIVVVDSALEMPSVHNLLELGSARPCAASEALCTTDRGCLRCEGEPMFCPEDAEGGNRCCDSPFDCETNSTVCDLL